MLRPSSPRSARLRRASLLLFAAVLLCVCSVSCGLPAGHTCPHFIDCAKEGRHFCKAGSSHCGPCLSALQENEEGRCVERRRHRQHVTLDTDLDTEIDFLQSVLAKQEASEIISPQKQTKHHGAVTSETGGKKTDATKPDQKHQTSPSDERAHAATPPPHSAPPDPPTPQPRVTVAEGRVAPLLVPAHKDDTIIVVLISLSVAVGTVAVILATVCYIKTQKGARQAQKVDYPAFGGAGLPPSSTTGSSMGDKTLAQNAQMYHYQHQKQQMLSMGNHKPEPKVPDSEATSDEEEVGGDFTVYECPGLAPTGEMEVKNPLFDDSTLPYQGNHK